MEKKKLIMDGLLYIVTALVGGTIFNTSIGGTPFEWITPFILIGFIPFGWRWIDSIIETYGIMTLLIKMIFSMLVCVFVGPVVLIKDIVAVVRG